MSVTYEDNTNEDCLLSCGIFSSSKLHVHPIGRAKESPYFAEILETRSCPSKPNEPVSAGIRSEIADRTFGSYGNTRLPLGHLRNRAITEHLISCWCGSCYRDVILNFCPRSSLFIGDKRSRLSLTNHWTFMRVIRAFSRVANRWSMDVSGVYWL